MASSTNASAPDEITPAPADPSAAASVLTFLFTDVEGSTRLWEQSPGAMRAALERHDEILRAAIAEAGGTLVKTTGDGMMAVFAGRAGAIAAVSAALGAQRHLGAEPWPDHGRIRVRIGIHTGDADARAGDYFGPAVNRTARIMAAGHGGQVLLSGATAALVAADLPDGAAVRDLGEHRLKDLERPERLFQLGAGGLAAEFPPLATLDLRPNNLPTQTSPFVGRDAELRAIRERLDDPAVRLLTLTGPGGTGKTRLALRAAADQIDRFEDGVFFVDLVSAADDDAVLALLAAAVGIADAKDRSPLDELRRHLRGRHVLVVLDTFEQVTSAAPLIVELLGDCPGVKILVTSREALRVRGENVLSVPPLSLPGGTSAASAEELGQFEAIQLFVERARAVRADFRLTDDNAAAVAEICRRLDGLPLAIELATARMNLFTPEALRDRLGSRLKALGSGARDLPARQQTLRATIEWSYQLLEPAEQRLFELASAFAASSVAAIEAVVLDLDPPAGEIDVVDGLASLLGKSLIRAADAGDAAAGRVAMLETIREYAAERLAAQPKFAADVRAAHARHFADVAGTAWGASSGPQGERALDDLFLDLDNLRIAWRFWVDRADPERLGQMVDGLWHLYEERGWYHLTIELINDQLRVLATQPPGTERSDQELTLRTSLVRALTMLRGYTAEVEDEYLRILELFEGEREVPQVFPVLRSLGAFHGFRGEFDKAAVYANEIIRLAETQNDPSMRIDGQILSGVDLAFSGRIEDGLAQLDAAIAAFERGDYRRRRLRLGIDPRISCLTTSGLLLWLSGFPDQAVPRGDRAIELAAELDHPYSLAYAYYHNGFIHLWRLEPEAVRERATQALEVARAADLPIWQALGLCLLGTATSMLGEPDEGLRLITEGIDQYRGLRTPPVFWPMIRAMQAGTHLAAGHPAAALPLVDEALEIAGPDGIVAPGIHILRGDILAVQGHPEEATAAYERARSVAGRFAERSPELRALLRLCRVTAGSARAQRVEELRARHATFTEGFETADLLEAARILAGT